MKKKWIVLALPVLAALTIWVTIHFRELHGSVFMGSSYISLTLGNGDLELGTTFADSRHENFFSVPFASIDTLSYDEANLPVALCLYDDRGQQDETLNPFAETPSDPFRANYPTLKQTAFGKPLSLTTEHVSPFHLCDIRIPFWLVFGASFIPLLWWGYLQMGRRAV